MTTTEARAGLPELLDRVDAGEEITITRHGRVVAVVVRPDALRVRRDDQALIAAARVREALKAGRRSSLSAVGLISDERADELVAEIRTQRQDR